MGNCFFCDAVLVKKGLNKAVVPLEGGEFVFVEINESHHCIECQESYVDTQQLLEGFNQIQEALGDTKTVGKGVYY